MTTSTTQMYPPLKGSQTISFNGRTYSSVNGAAVAVPNFDVSILSANGWTTTAAASVTAPILAALGDSGVAWADNYGSFQNGLLSRPVGTAPNNRLLSAENFVNWAQVLTYQNVQIADGYIYGAAGMGSDVILSVGLPYILSLSPLPSVCIVLCGSNDQFYNGAIASQPAASAVPLTYAQTTSNLNSIYAGLLGAGIDVIAVPIMPRSDVAKNITPAQTGVLLQVNEWIKKQQKILNNFYVADATLALANPADASFGSINAAASGGSLATAVATAGLANIQSYPLGTGGSNSPYATGTYVTTRPDSVHTSALGAYFMGKSVAQILNNLYPAKSSFLNVNNATVSTSNAYGNLLTNSNFLTQTAPAAPGFGGTQAQSWSLASTDSATSLAYCALVPSVNFPLQLLQRFQIGNSTTASPAAAGTYNRSAVMVQGGATGLTAGNTNGANCIRMFQDIPSGSLATFAGAYIEATLYVEVPAITSAPFMQGISGIGIQLKGDADASGLYIPWGMSPNFGPYPQEAWSGVILVRRKILSQALGDPITDTNIRFQIYIQFDGRGTSLTNTNSAEPVFADIRVGMPKARVVF